MTVMNSENWVTYDHLWLAIGFFGQTVTCFASDLGIIACEANADHHDESDAGKSEQSPSSHCCHCSSHIPILNGEQVVLSSAISGQNTLLSRNDLAPDGPVREIDHPPQLS